VGAGGGQDARGGRAGGERPRGGAEELGPRLGRGGAAAGGAAAAGGLRLGEARTAVRGEVRLERRGEWRAVGTAAGERAVPDRHRKHGGAARV
jgi:hypothetical protein